MFLIFFILSPFAYAYISITEKNKRTDYLGKEKAKIAQDWWNDKRNSKINYVQGNEWEAGNLSYHLKDRPKWLGNYNLLYGEIYLCDEKCLKYK